MQFLFTAIGSHGDVHPVVGIARGMLKRGHSVTVLANPRFAGLIASAGLNLIPMGTEEEFDAVTQDPDIWHPTKGVQTIARSLVALAMRPSYEKIVELSRLQETVVVSAALDLGARIAHEKHGIPTISIQLAPTSFRSLYESPHLPPAVFGRWVPKWAKRLQLYFADHWIIDPILAPELNAFRAELDLPPVKEILNTWWHSPLRVIGMFPDWFGPPQPDWPAQVRLTNFPLWDEREVAEIPADTDAFLRNGDPPIAFTPGSAMVHGHQFFQAAANACERLGCRGVLLTRHAEQIPADLPAGVRHFDFIPFSYLLPRCAAVVHHGGVGSLSQGLAAGTPQLIMPMAFDQPDNALRLRKLGVAEAIKPKRFRGPAVARALERLITSPAVAKNCRAVAEKVAATNGIDQACDLIEQCAKE